MREGGSGRGSLRSCEGEGVTGTLVRKVLIGEIEGEMAAPVWNWLTGGSLWRGRT